MLLISYSKPITLGAFGNDNRMLGSKNFLVACNCLGVGHYQIPNAWPLRHIRHQMPGVCLGEGGGVPAGIDSHIS